MRKRVKNKRGTSGAFLAAAAVWVVWAIFFPLFSAWHFAIPLALSILAARAVISASRKKYADEDTEECEPEPEPEKKPKEEPKSTGNPELDQVLHEGKFALQELGRLYASIANPDVKQRILKIIDVTDKIIKDAQHDPSDIPQIQRFLSTYMPTTIKLLNEYDRMYATGTVGDNVSGTMTRIENALDGIIVAYGKHYDNLFNNENLDIETDIQVLETLLKREGLSGSDFKIEK